MKNEREDADLISNMAGCFERDRLRDCRFADSVTDRVIDRSKKQPRQQSDVGHTLQKLPRALKVNKKCFTIAASWVYMDGFR